MAAQVRAAIEETGANGRELLRVNNLSLTFDTFEGKVHAIDGVSLTLNRGETLGILGESGSGKSTLASAIISLTPENGHIDGTIEFEGSVIASAGTTGAGLQRMKRKQLKMLSEKLRELRWKNISIIFQGSMNAFNPVYTIEKQLVEVYKLHTDLDKDEIKDRVVQTVKRAGLNPIILKSYPHELSGGMKQRAIIAMALALNPRLVIADEPTTGLDVITQAKIISELKKMRRTEIDSMIIISHDVGVVSQLADKVAVLYAGKLMEFGSIGDIYLRSANPYTRALLDSYPSIMKARSVMRGIPGAPPDPLHATLGCRFAPRCLFRQEICAVEDPPFVDVGSGHMSLCHFAVDVASGKLKEPSLDQNLTVALRAPLLNGQTTLFDVKGLSKFFHLRGTIFGTVFSRESSKTVVRAVENVDVKIRKGEVFALVGESGSGKTTLGKTLLRLLKSTDGSLLYYLTKEENASVHNAGHSHASVRRVEIDVGNMDERNALYRDFRRDTQLIFQDPYDSIDPKMTVLDIVTEPIIAYRSTKSPVKMMEMVKEALRIVRLSPPEIFLDRYPHELSGGERQRVAAARALVLKPEFLVADEPISMLDVSLRAGFMNLLLQLRNERGITIFYITHDIASARYISDRIMVLYLGVAVELGDAESTIKEPLHPYTKALIQAVPLPTPTWNPGVLEIYGEIGSAANVMSGCRFVERCAFRQEICRDEPPPKREVGERWYLCHFSQSELSTIKTEKAVLREKTRNMVMNVRSLISSQKEKESDVRSEAREQAITELEALVANTNDDKLLENKIQEVKQLFNL